MTGKTSRVLICAKPDKTEWLQNALAEFHAEIAESAARARAIAETENFGVIVLSTPLPDEFGLDLAADLHRQGGGSLVILAKGDAAAEIRYRLKFAGAIVLARPVSQSELAAAVIAGEAMFDLALRLKAENSRLSAEFADWKTVAQAKFALMDGRNMTEDEAHRFIQRTAMDNSYSRAEAARFLTRTITNEQ